MDGVKTHFGRKITPKRIRVQVVYWTTKGTKEGVSTVIVCSEQDSRKTGI